MDVDSMNNSFNVSEEVKEQDSNVEFNESGEVEESKKGMCFISNQARNRTKRSEVNPLEPSLSSKIDCKARVRATLQKDGRYKLTILVLEHTHDFIPSDSQHFPMNERILTPVKRRLEVNDATGIGVARNFHSIVVEAGGYEALMFDEQDARNYIQNARRLRLGVGDAESATFYFHKMQQQNSNFYLATDLDEDGRMRNLFWADARSRATYKAFGDVELITTVTQFCLVVGC
ncbi:protein FAR-RED IMPAIRED RESPONSE 1-like [Camellia sinensis]|uniref:protein FAR-RED IMPAIRED RESPONSE 1-like n=1 Tax=Camellia sinensis TaxID=4442 RepID=UPI0010356903|nr:protein FAR-RED IMPAIRED RESPONSE 1-like [Camellia sinensis]